MDWQETKAFFKPCFPENICSEMELLYPGELREIRIRANKPVVFCTSGRQTALDWIPSATEVRSLTEALSEHSLYTKENELGQGYVTLRGGHRMGLCGQVQIKSLKKELHGIGSICIRIAGEWKGCADALIPYARKNRSLQSGLIIGTPGTGKTSLLRDIARQLASGHDAAQTAIIDERGELAACVDGIPQLDTGAWSDVLDGCAKPDAVAWLIRSMCPHLIITDELSCPQDVYAIQEAMACGAAIIATVHAASLNELASRPVISTLLAQRVFAWYAVLHPSGGARIQAMYDKAGSPIKL